MINDERIKEINEWLYELKKFSKGLSKIPSKTEHAKKNISMIEDIEVIIEEYKNGTI